MPRSSQTSTSRGTPDLYEVTWKSGHVEQIAAHQVIVPNFMTRTTRVMFHAEIDGRWTLVMYANESDIQSIRNITSGETLPSEGGAS